MADKPNVGLLYKTLATIIGRREGVKISITIAKEDGSEPPIQVHN